MSRTASGPACKRHAPAHLLRHAHVAVQHLVHRHLGPLGANKHAHLLCTLLGPADTGRRNPASRGNRHPRRESGCCAVPPAWRIHRQRRAATCSERDAMATDLAHTARAMPRFARASSVRWIMLQPAARPPAQCSRALCAFTLQCSPNWPAASPTAPSSGFRPARCPLAPVRPTPFSASSRAGRTAVVDACGPMPMSLSSGVHFLPLWGGSYRPDPRCGPLILQASKPSSLSNAATSLSSPSTAPRLSTPSATSSSTRSTLRPPSSTRTRTWAPSSLPAPPRPSQVRPAPPPSAGYVG